MTNLVLAAVMITTVNSMTFESIGASGMTQEEHLRALQECQAADLQIIDITHVEGQVTRIECKSTWYGGRSGNP